ncbi:MAG: PEP-CTERM sorting domain-containing protein [Verrucomicrobia bacterium]|nr:PEP-CTERM sorting domain-containing protein [Verrucomicrobiota bacterium]
MSQSHDASRVGVAVSSTTSLSFPSNPATALNHESHGDSFVSAAGPAEGRSLHLSLRTRLSDWRLFAAAGGAALAATTSSAEAAIVNGSLNLDYKMGGNANSNLNKTFKAAFGTGALGLFRNTARTTSNFSSHSGARAYGNNFKIFGGGTSFNGGGNALNFAKGHSVSGKHPFRFGTLATDVRIDGNPNSFGGNFGLNKVGYLGLSRANGGKGWIQVEILDQNGDGRPDEVKLLNYAYNTAANGPILAGGGLPASVPEPSSKALALLALGAGGVLAWRKARREHGLPPTTGPVEAEPAA